jgi:hypothetical protein
MVDVIVRLNVDQNDGGFILGLVVRVPGGGPEMVKTSTVSTDTGLQEVAFEAVPAGIYSIVAVSLDGTVSGTYKARSENIPQEDVLANNGLR